MAALPLLLAAVTVLVSAAGPASAATIDVGGPNGWTFTVANWTPPIIYVGDTLRFAWPSTEQHSVVRVFSQASFDNCLLRRGFKIPGPGAITVTLRHEGFYYFICGVPGHCDAGQKVLIYANNRSKPVIPPPASPPPPSPPPPPSSSSGPQLVVVGNPGTFWNFGINQLWKVPAVHVGDTLQFQWRLDHDVVLFKDQAHYSKCNFFGGQLLYPIRFLATFNYLVPASAAGKTLYFGCSTPGHCRGGMKVAIPILP